MKIKMNGLYGIEKATAYLRLSGLNNCCFDFVNDIKLATDLTEKQAEKEMSHSEWYCKQFDAKNLEIV